MRTPFPFPTGGSGGMVGWGVELPTKFSTGPQFLEGRGLLGKRRVNFFRGRGCNF